MVAACVTKHFGLLASDAAKFDTAQSKISFDAVKLFYTSNTLVSFIGTPLYFSQMDKSKLSSDFPSMVLYMKNYLKKIRPEVEKMLRSEIADEDENKPHFCMFVLGVHKTLPTNVQFNSYLDFEPKYLYSSDKPKFSTIFFGDDNPKKKQLFLESTEYMEQKTRKLAKKNVELTPGVLGEVLIRGIYKKADAETLLPPYKKYAGGVVSVAGILSNQVIFPLSGVSPA